jgi:hypothetical protein
MAGAPRPHRRRGKRPHPLPPNHAPLPNTLNTGPITCAPPRQAIHLPPRGAEGHRSSSMARSRRWASRRRVLRRYGTTPACLSAVHYPPPCWPAEHAAPGRAAPRAWLRPAHYRHRRLTTPTPAGNGGVRTIWDLWILDLFGIWKFEDLCIRRLGDCCDFVDNRFFGNRFDFVQHRFGC